MEQDIQDEQSNSLIRDAKERQSEERKKLHIIHLKMQSIMREGREIEENIAAYQRVIELELEYQSKIDGEESSNNLHNEEFASENNSIDYLEGDETISYENNSYSSLDPMDMLRPRFQSMSLNEVASIILEESDTSMHLDDIATAAYATNTSEEFKRAKGSIAATLRNGFDEKNISNSLWLKVGRGIYAKKSYYDDSSSEYTAGISPGFDQNNSSKN